MKLKKTRKILKMLYNIVYKNNENILLVVSQNTVNKSFSTRRTKQNSLQIKMFLSNCAIWSKK